nr:hypothetical protein [uncultured Rhodoferax sp.]
MQNVKRALHWAVWTGLAMVLVACGNGGKGIPPEEKHVIIGTAAHIKTKRESTHHLNKPLPFGVTHKRFKDGKQLADDSPHPYILSSGTVLLSARNNGLARVVFHEDNLGTISNAVPASFLVSDSSIVSSAAADPQHPNAVFLTLTGKKGNSYITGLDARGDAISKFMVLAAVPDSDVLVVSDPSIHPRLCSSRIEPSFSTVCDYNISTNFDLGDSGGGFSMDPFLKNGTSTPKYILFDDVSIEKLKNLNTNGFPAFTKKAIYFESIDTLFVMNEGVSKVDRMAMIGRNPLDPADRDPANPSLWFNALPIHHVATQEEFNTYIDFGGKLTSSPLRAFGVTDILTHEITPDNPAEAVLVGAIFVDGSRVSASEETIRYVAGAGRSPIESYVYKMHHVGENSNLKEGGLECRASATAGNLVKFAITSLKSVAKLTLDGDFNWNGGHPNLGVDLNPQINSGGQVKFFLDGRVKMDCEIELYAIKASEWGVPLFATVQFSIPVSFATGVSASGSADMVLVLPDYNLGSPTDTNKPGKVGINYTSNGGFKSDFQMQSTVAKNHLGVADGTKLRGSTTGKIGMGFEVGVNANLALRAMVNTWILRASVDATIGSILVGFKADGAYDIDTAKKTSKMSPKGDAGFGAFLEFSPTISVKTKFFTWSFNIYEYVVPPWWWYKLPIKEGEEEPFEPEETRDQAIFVYCDASYPCSGQRSKTFKTGYTNSSEKLQLESVKDIPGFDYYGQYFYQYVFRDKITGVLRLNTIPMNQADDWSLKVFKYGAVDILAEGVVTKVFNGGDQTCMYWFNGDEALKNYFDCLHWWDR